MAHNYSNARAFANACLANNVGYRDKSNSDFDGQCVALIKNFYEVMTTVPNPFGARGNGKDVAGILISQGYGKAVGAPQAGTVISYPATSTNPYGHVALAISSTEMVEQNSAYIPHNGVNGNNTYKPRICGIRPGYIKLALPQGFYEDAINNNNGVISPAFGGRYKVIVDQLFVRTGPSVNSAKVKSADGTDAYYSRSMKDPYVKLDGWYKIADNYVWGKYTSSSGQVRYIAVGPNTGTVSASKDFLIKG